MSDFYVELDLTTGMLRRRQATNTGGAGQGGRIVALRSDGTLDPAMVPNTQSVVVNIVANEALNAGDAVNVFYNGTERRVRKAIATGSSTQAHGFVLADASAGSSVPVYLSGLNTAIPRGAVTASQVGQPVFLSASTGGAVTLTPPSSTNNLVQRLGFIVHVDTTNNVLHVLYDIQPPIVV